MSSEIVVALVAASVTVLASLLTLLGQFRVLKITASQERHKRQEDKRDEVERVMSRYREPLLRAAYDLQSRLFNISAQSFLTVYWLNGTKEEREYAVNNTLFLIAQLFGWNEIIRREVQFLDAGDQEQTRLLSELQDNITHLWLNDGYGRSFRIFAGDQRAIGERMIRKTERGLECRGYADFVDTLAKRPGRIPHLDLLQRDIENLAQAGTPRVDRLRMLQHALIDLLRYLDPLYVRYPERSRSKLL